MNFQLNFKTQTIKHSMTVNFWWMFSYFSIITGSFISVKTQSKNLDLDFVALFFWFFWSCKYRNKVFHTWWKETLQSSAHISAGRDYHDWSLLHSKHQTLTAFSLFYTCFPLSSFTHQFCPLSHFFWASSDRCADIFNLFRLYFRGLVSSFSSPFSVSVDLWFCSVLLVRQEDCHNLKLDSFTSLKRTQWNLFRVCCKVASICRTRFGPQLVWQWHTVQ